MVEVDEAVEDQAVAVVVVVAVTITSADTGTVIAMVTIAALPEVVDRDGSQVRSSAVSSAASLESFSVRMAHAKAAADAVNPRAGPQTKNQLMETPMVPKIMIQTAAHMRAIHTMNQSQLYIRETKTSMTMSNL